MPLRTAALLAVLFCTPLTAQQIDGPAPQRPSTPRPRLPDSSEAIARFLLAHRQQIDKQWEAAADTLHGLTRRHPDALLPIDYENGEPVLYWCTRDAVYAHLAKAPAELGDAYRKLDSALSPITRPAATRPTTLPAHSWPTFAGSADASAVSPVSLAKEPAGPLYVIDLPDRDPRRARAGKHLGGPVYRPVTVFPVADNNQLFFHDGVQLSAVELHSGKPLTAWLATHPDGRFTFEAAIPDSKAVDAATWTSPLQHTLTVTGERVLAVMGVNRFGRDADLFDAGTALVCLDRKTGQRLWSVLPYPRWNDPPALHKPEFHGCPRVVGDRVFVLIRDRRPDDTEAVYAACLRVSDGAMRWHTLIATTPVVGSRWESQWLRDAHTPGHVAATPHHVFVQGPGALACLDASTGRVTWLACYPRWARLNVPARMGRDWPEAPKPWHLNPLILSSGHLFALPVDAEHLLALDAATGRTVKRIGREIVRGDRHFTLCQLVSADEQRVMASTDSTVLYADWRAYSPPPGEPKRLDASDATLWWNPVERVEGRCFRSSSGLALPTPRALVHMREHGGKVTWRWPRGSGVWPDKHGPRNLVAVEGHLVAAGSQAVAVHVLAK